MKNVFDNGGGPTMKYISFTDAAWEVRATYNED